MKWFVTITTARGPLTVASRSTEDAAHDLGQWLTEIDATATGYRVHN